MKFLATLLLFFTGTLNGQKARNYHVVTARLTAPAEKSIRRVLAQHNNGDVRYAAVVALQAIAGGDDELR